MRAIEYSSEADALLRSQVEAYSHGCDVTTITQYWWVVEEQAGKFYCLIGDDEVEDTVVNI